MTQSDLVVCSDTYVQAEHECGTSKSITTVNSTSVNVHYSEEWFVRKKHWIGIIRTRADGSVTFKLLHKKRARKSEQIKSRSQSCMSFLSLRIYYYNIEAVAIIWRLLIRKRCFYFSVCNQEEQGNCRDRW